MSAPFQKRVGSRKALILSSQVTAYGFKNQDRILSTQKVQEENVQERSNSRKRKADNQNEELAEKLQRLDVPEVSEAFEANTTLESFLSGDQSFTISHAGGEFQSLFSDDFVRAYEPIDSRTREDRTEIRNEGFKRQREQMTTAYVWWQFEIREGGLAEAAPPIFPQNPPEGALKVEVVDTYHSYIVQTDVIDSEVGIAAAFIRHGLIPCAPSRPSLVFTTRLLELYRTTHLRCPHLAIQPFVKSICDLHGTAYRPYLAQQFTICFDVYLDIRASARERLEVVLNRGDTWRLKNTCPACTYKLEDEAPLKFNMLFTMDGNDSLKRILRKDHNIAGDDNTVSASTHSHERPDSRRVQGDYYLTREEVDRWAQAPSGDDRQQVPMGEVEDNNPCATRWSNMSTEKTSRMWGVFDETGVFVSLCRHQFVLLIADMVRSGELSKYPLAMVDKLLEAFGQDLGGGYDIGCKFKTTVARSSLGERAQELNYTSLVGLFHGHAHRRLCQLDHLATYIEGLGLEDLEGCERFFSKSNALASSVRYASIFHRQQNIAEYIRHVDNFETAQNLSTFLVNNYKQALEIIRGKSTLEESMAKLGIEGPEVFHTWLVEEKEYLKGLADEPIHDSLEMDYYQYLVNYNRYEVQAQEIRDNWEVVVAQDPATVPKKGRGKGKGKGKGKASAIDKMDNVSREIQLKHAVENARTALSEVQRIELELGIEKRWEPTMPEYQHAAEMVSQRRYRRALDHLEALVVSRLFELTKLNMSQTGYKQRKHIANALKQRSHAISAALDRYNAAAKAMIPRRPSLEWEEVVQYTSLADFDLLRDARQDIRERPWANLAHRQLMNQYFKIRRAEEEIQRLNIEIRRVITHARDEEEFLSAKEQDFLADAPLAHQIRLYRLERCRFSKIHLRRFEKLASRSDFTGDITSGTPTQSTICTSGIIQTSSPTSLLPLSAPAQDAPGFIPREDDFEPEIDPEDDLSEAFAIALAVMD